MREEIRRIIGLIMGQPLSDMWRYAGCQRFEFGVQFPMKNRRGQDVTMGDWALVVSCHWEIKRPEGVFVTAEDFGPRGERRDERATPFYQRLRQNGPLVEAIEISAWGGLEIRMTEEFILYITPDEDEEEQWRFFRARSDGVDLPKPSHLVLEGTSLRGRHAEPEQDSTV